MTIDSLFRIETEAKVEKLKHMKLEVVQDVNKPYGISPREVVRS